MSTFKKVFERKHTFLPVVHVEEKRQAFRNAQIAKEEGADGVFLINHNISHMGLFECYEAIRERLPDFWVGINCLDLGRLTIYVISKDMAGLWVDNAGIEDDSTKKAWEFTNIRKERQWDGLYFGGVAFKYQREVTDVAKVAKLAIPFVDVITTSGISTGKVPDLHKIKMMRGAIGDHPLAIASGITPENVAEYMPYANCFLVATGISDSHTEFNAKKVRALSKVLGK